MTHLTKEQRKALKDAYKMHFAGKNWGSWQIDKAPVLPVSFQLEQYENRNGLTVDLIKFEEPVKVEGTRFPGITYVLSNSLPDHQTNGHL